MRIWRIVLSALFVFALTGAFFGGAAAQVKKTTDSAKQTTEKTTDSAKRTTQKTTDSAKRTTQKAAESAEQRVQETAAPIKQAAADTSGQSAQRTVQPTVTTTQQTAQQTVDSTTQTVEQAGQSASPVIQSPVESATALVAQPIEAASTAEQTMPTTESSVPQALTVQLDEPILVLPVPQAAPVNRAVTRQRTLSRVTPQVNAPAPTIDQAPAEDPAGQEVAMGAAAAEDSAAEGTTAVDSGALEVAVEPFADVAEAATLAYIPGVDEARYRVQPLAEPPARVEQEPNPASDGQVDGQPETLAGPTDPIREVFATSIPVIGSLRDGLVEATRLLGDVLASTLPSMGAPSVIVVLALVSCLGLGFFLRRMSRSTPSEP